MNEAFGAGAARAEEEEAGVNSVALDAGENANDADRTAPTPNDGRAADAMDLPTKEAPTRANGDFTNDRDIGSRIFESR